MKLPPSTDYRRSGGKRYIIGRPRLDDVTWLCVRAAFGDRALCAGSWGYPSASAANLLASKYTSWLLLCCKHALLYFGLLRGEDDECTWAHCEREGKGIAGCKGNSMYRVLKKTQDILLGVVPFCVWLWEFLQGVRCCNAMGDVVWNCHVVMRSCGGSSWGECFCGDFSSGVQGL